VHELSQDEWEEMMATVGFAKDRTDIAPSIKGAGIPSFAAFHPQLLIPVTSHEPTADY